MTTCPNCSASVPAGAKSCAACYQLLSAFAARPTRSHAYREGITITDIDISFGRLVFIIFKFAVAALPTVIVMWMVTATIFFLFAAMFGAAVLSRIPTH